MQDVKLHFLAYHKKHLRWQEISTLYNFWYLLMLFTNILIFLATLMKIYHDYNDKVMKCTSVNVVCMSTILQNLINIEVVESISILFGIGNILLWCGLFGLLKYFESLNVSVILCCIAQHLYIVCYHVTQCMDYRLCVDCFLIWDQ